MKYTTTHNDPRKKATLKHTHTYTPYSQNVCEQDEINETATKSNGIESMWTFYINQQL